MDEKKRREHPQDCDHDGHLKAKSQTGKGYDRWCPKCKTAWWTPD